MCCMSSWVAALASGFFPAVILIIFFFVRSKATNAYISRLLYDRGLKDLAHTFLSKEVWSKKHKKAILQEARSKIDEVYPKDITEPSTDTKNNRNT